jgi:hypothetical protein
MNRSIVETLSASSSAPETSTRISSFLVLMTPAGTTAFWSATAARTSLKFRPSAASLAGEKER